MLGLIYGVSCVWDDFGNYEGGINGVSFWEKGMEFLGISAGFSFGVSYYGRVRGRRWRFFFSHDVCNTDIEHFHVQTLNRLPAASSPRCFLCDPCGGDPDAMRPRMAIDARDRQTAVAEAT
ncbi:hypothetical protein IMZ48_37540 [Candidatus Bathyarchaeota archaeon]|nr:hypothetical protein [Candidatus Bathyarchaeota archaeon]